MIEIWTDVNGIMTADPRICPDALRVKTISFEEAAELAYFGAKVLHPATILPAVQKNIPVAVLNSRNPENEGTRITALASHCRSPFKSIAVKKRLTIIDVVASRMLMSHGYLKSIFDVFDKHKCAVDMVSTSEVSVSLTVDSNEKLPEISADLGKVADVKYEGRKALVCMVGEDIRGQNGIAAQVFQAIRHVNVRMISQGASEINMSFMIEEDDVEEAVRSLHAAFFRDPDPAVFDVEARAAAVRRRYRSSRTPAARKEWTITMLFLVLGRGKTGSLVADVAKNAATECGWSAKRRTVTVRRLPPTFLAQFDAVIDFTTPEAVVPNMRACLASGAHMVVGTTGWHAHLKDIKALAEKRGAGLVYGSNFSIGVQALYKIAHEMAQAAPGFKFTHLETHHAEKKDAPSGTALALKHALESANPHLNVPIESKREGDSPGIHVIRPGRTAI